jgi:hypothetical protein
MMPSISSQDALLITIVLATLAIGLPIVMVLAIRFLWDRNLNLGRSKELEKLIWQLHRIASAMEHQLNLSFPPVQPGTEEARDVAYLQQVPAQPQPAASNATTAPEARPAEAPKPEAPAAVEQQATPLPPLQVASGETPRAGVNSMFGL